MNSWDFGQCRIFLEAMIAKHPDNKELVLAYIKLIEKKTEFDIEFFKCDVELKKDYEKNQTERFKVNSEITKTSIVQNIGTPGY